MRIGVMAVGRLKDGPERELLARYLERARACGKPLGFSGFEIVEIAESRATRPADRKAEEAREILTRAAGSLIVALDERGRSRDSQAFAGDLVARRDGGSRSLTFVIGGADGFDPSVLNASDGSLSFGTMTLPHQLVRVLLAEQLYRAMTIVSGHPYHRS
jgi:23S rRNA (pseudouridine1915-N3)-methyltransferase